MKTPTIIILLLISLSLFLQYSSFLTRTRFFRCPEFHYPTCTTVSHEFQPFNHSEPIITNISHIVFGIGSSSNSWNLRRNYSHLWWRPNLTRGFVWLDENPEPGGGGGGDYNNYPSYRVSSKEWKRFKHSSSPSAVRIARILLDLFRIGLPDVRWFVMGDDDTVFFTDNLVSVLARYDHRQMYYIGGNSESVEQDVMHSYKMAFGGGGFAVSYPLAVVLAGKLDGCLDRYHYFYGSDERISACVAEIGVSLTIEPGFHQIDLRRDIYGLLAAHPTAPLVSLHHLDYVDPIFPNQGRMESLNLLMKAATADPLRTLQQAISPDYNYNHQKLSISISWGYTIQLYPYLVYANELRLPLQTFQTWHSWSNGPFTFNTRPLRTDPCQQPLVYFFETVQEVIIGQDHHHNLTLSTYRLHLDQDQEKRCDNAEYSRTMGLKIVEVVAPKMNPNEWKMRPRREDCVIIESWKRTSMRLRIGSFQV
ncbi:uncharacterized protein LOC124927468 [Impatiens glandulifera]|uniref:uncharacterized protein LOC124927468 n=1 Tax=Impatiens glandulifera TaxID=253017 RepID=UPI001FB07210|nr:uncharacterized protein LOC124927468 [Impatiens glandulifera]